MEYFRDSIDLLRATFLIGAVFALIYKKKAGVTPGGIIVPGLLACLLAVSFKAFLISLVTSLLCWAIYKVTLSQIALSQRSTSLVIMTLSVFLCIAEALLTQKFKIISQEMQLFSMVVPGLITIGARKYGLGRVFQGTIITTGATYFVGLILSVLVPVAATSYFSTTLGSYPSLELPHPLWSFAVSMGVAALLYLVFKVRSGGYLMAPFLVMLAVVSPLQGLMLLLGIVSSYLTVRLVLAKSLIVGLERFVLSLFCGYFVVSICDYIATLAKFDVYYVSTITLIIAVAVLTNDLTLQPAKKAVGKGFAPALLASYAARMVG